MPHTFTTIRQLRAAFWLEHPDLIRKPGKPHNEQSLSTRVAFCDYVDHLHRHGAIPDRLAQTATLGD